MIIEEIKNHAYKTSGKLKAAQKRAQNEAKRVNGRGSGSGNMSIGKLLTYASNGSKRSLLTPGKTARSTQTNQASSHADVPAGIRSFGATIGYAAQEQKKFNDLPEEIKAELIYSQNLHLSPDLAEAEMKAVADQNTTGIIDACRHIVVSWNIDENPDKKEMADVVSTYLKAAGYEQHQAMAYVHRNTDKIHVHIIVNAVNPITFKGIDQKYIRNKANYKIHEQVARMMEIKYNRTIVEGNFNCVENGKVVKQTKKSNERPSPTQQKSRKISALERNSGLPSFQTHWTKSDESKSLRTALSKVLEQKNGNALSWHDIHVVFAAHNLELREVVKDGRKFGYTIHDKSDSSLSIKASEFDIHKDIFKAGKLDRIINAPFIPSAHILNRPVENVGYKKRISDETTAADRLYPYYAKQKSLYQIKIKAVDVAFKSKLDTCKSQRATYINAMVIFDELSAPPRTNQYGSEESKPISPVVAYKNETAVFADLNIMREEQREKARKRLAREKTKYLKLQAELEKTYDVQRKAILGEFELYRGTYRAYLNKIIERSNDPIAIAELKRINKNILSQNENQTKTPQTPGVTEKPGMTQVVGKAPGLSKERKKRVVEVNKI
jgi:hypothetical protein